MHEFIKENYYILGSSKIAKIVGCGRGKVLKIAKELGLDTSISATKRLLKSKTQIESYNKYCKILNFDCPLTAYALGFLWADGHLKKDHLTCSVARKDSDHLKSIFVEGFNFKMKNYSSKVKEKCYLMTRFDLYNKDVMAGLAVLDLENKTLVSPVKIKEMISSENFKHFIAGFFDGDGCISYKPYKTYKVSLAFDSRSNTDFFEQYLSSIFSKIFIGKGKGNSKTIYISRKEDVIKFYNNFIKDCGFSLPRKRSIFERFLSQPKSQKESVYRRSITAILPSGEIKQFTSATEASRELKINRSLINEALERKGKSRGISFVDSRVLRKFKNTKTNEIFEAFSDVNEGCVWRVTESKPRRTLKDNLININE